MTLLVPSWCHRSDSGFSDAFVHPLPMLRVTGPVGRVLFPDRFSLAPPATDDALPRMQWSRARVVRSNGRAGCGICAEEIASCTDAEMARENDSRTFRILAEWQTKGCRATFRVRVRL